VHAGDVFEISNRGRTRLQSCGLERGRRRPCVRESGWRRERLGRVSMLDVTGPGALRRSLTARCASFRPVAVALRWPRYRCGDQR